MRLWHWSIILIFLLFQPPFSQSNNQVSQQDDLPNIQNQEPSIQNKKLKTQLDSLRREFSRLRDIINDTKDYAKDTITHANNIITWSSYILAAIGVIAGMLGIFGFYNLNEAKKLKKELEKEKSDFEEEIINLKYKSRNISNIVFSHLEAELARMQGDFQKALDCYRRVLSYDKQNMEAYLRSAWIFLALKNPDKALNIVEDALKYKNNKGEEYYCCLILILGFALKGDTQKTADAFVQAVSIMPDSPLAFRTISVGYLILDEIELAKKYLAEAIMQKRDREALSMFLMACILRYDSDETEAKKLFNRTIKLELRELNNVNELLPPCLYLAFSHLAIGDLSKYHDYTNKSKKEKGDHVLLLYFEYSLQLLRRCKNPPEHIDEALNFLKELQYKNRKYHIFETIEEIV